MAGADKLGTVAPHRVAPLGQLTRLVTTEAAPTDHLAHYLQLGIEVSRVLVPSTVDGETHADRARRPLDS